MNTVIKTRTTKRLSACARRALRHAAAAAILLAQIVTGTHAQTICSKPVQPLCSMEGGSTGSEPERLRCLEDVGRYIDGLDT